MYSVALFFMMLVVHLPILVVLIVGLILLSTLGRRLPPRSRQLARAGLGAMLAEVIASAAWTVVLPNLVAQASRSSALRTTGIASATAGFLLAALLATGIGLLVAALLAARDPVPLADAPRGSGRPGDGGLGVMSTGR